VTQVPVVAAVVERDGRYLLGRRPATKRHGGLWEFPGGKLDEGEDTTDAVRRELAEELDLEVTDVSEVLHAVADSGAPFVIRFHRVAVRGEARPLEHDEVGWFTLGELETLELAPADARFVTWLGARG
jgi:8-oxo-dGTP diphosphatase